METNNLIPALASWRWCLQVFILLLLSGNVALVVSAQTQLTPTQLPALQGAVQGNVNTTFLRDINSAVDHEVNMVGGISGAIAACGTTTSCSIIIPPTYTTSEAVPGYALDPNYPFPLQATTPGNISIFDQRYGDARMAVNPRGYTDGTVSSPNGWVYNYYAQQPQNAILTPLYILQNSWDGGQNQQYRSLNYYSKTTYAPISITNYSHTPGQHVGLGLNTTSYSIGDVLGIANYVYCFGGFNAEADEGCESQDNQVYMGSVAYAGTLTGAQSTGETSIAISPSQGLRTQGAGRFLIRLSSGTISSGSIAAISSGSGTLTTITGAGTVWPVSTAIAQLGTSVSAPGSITVTPASFSAGSMSNITTSTLVCVADGNAFEMLYPSSVTANTFTANFVKVHPSSATIAAGGVCGYLLDLTADDVNNSTFPNKAQAITGTLRFAWPAIASTSPTSLQLYVAGGGAYQQLNSRWDPSSADAYVLYPMAEVTSVQQNGGLSDTLTLGPNNVAWTTGDAVEEPLYPATHIGFGNIITESYYPNFPAAAGGYNLIYNMPLQGNDTMLGIRNTTPISMYKPGGGKYTSPMGIHIGGETGYSLVFDSPGDQWTIGIGCNSPCNSVSNIVAAANSSAYDYLQYDQGNKQWIITANSNSAQYIFGSTQWQTPLPNVSLGSDSNNIGYVATQSLRTNSSSNTDLTGELNFNSSASVSYSFAGAYNIHGECWAEPQFDIGSGNRYWITYAGSSTMTVSFASPVTGTVSYGCTARN